MVDDVLRIDIDNDQTRRAVELLLDAVAKEVKPGLLELKLAASTLRDLLEDPTPQSCRLAIRAFNAIDRDTRLRIQMNAASAATNRTQTCRKKDIPEPISSNQAGRQATSLLSALNFGGAGAGRDNVHSGKRSR